MIRFPGLLVLEVICALGIAGVGRMGLRAHHDPPPAHVALSLIGEREQRDGSWSGVDLVDGSDSSVDRFQLSVLPDQDVLLEVVAITESGSERIFPTQGHDGHLSANTSYALPGPHGFYELEGKVRLRVVMRPLAHRSGVDAPLAEGRRAIRLPLSDGSRLDASQRLYRLSGDGTLEWELHR